MADLAALARTHRAAILDVDAELARGLIDAYTTAWQRLKASVNAVTAEIQAARDAGEEVSAGWLLRQERLRALEHQIVSEVTAIARSANGSITIAQWSAIHMAERHAREAVTVAMGEPPAGAFFSFNAVPVEAVRELVGNLGEGKPLSALLDALGPDASAAVREALTSGVILGEGPVAIARRARTAFGGNASRAVQVSRDAVIRSYKTASIQSYRQNADVVKGWRWITALGSRCCAACVAMHNSEHPLTEEFHDHSRGRCAASPITRTWAELGFDVPDETRATAQTGPEWFADQPATVQNQIAGPAKLAAIKSGAILLEDLAGVSRSRVWGKTLTERSLTDVVGVEKAREIIAGVRA
jgi:hypothetical protein